MTAQAPVMLKHGNAYNIFILVLTIYALVLMAVLLLPIDDATREAVNLGQRHLHHLPHRLRDEPVRLTPEARVLHPPARLAGPPGSIPSFGFIRFTALFRLARHSRLGRITKLLQGQAGKDLVLDVLHNRSQYAAFITILLAGMVLSVSSIVILQFEVGAPDGNIKTGGDALWWAIVTITTVGYGDFYPVTFLGRLTGVFVMFTGIGIIGALASILASLLVSPASSDDVAVDDSPAVAESSVTANATAVPGAAVVTAAATPVTDPGSAAIAAESRASGPRSRHCGHHCRQAEDEASLHGAFASLETWRLEGLVSEVAAQFRLVLIDLRGHGKSDKPHDAAAYLISEQIADVVAVLDQLGIASAHVCGFSQGALVAGASAPSTPRGSAACSPSACRPGTWGWTMCRAAPRRWAGPRTSRNTAWPG